MNGWWSWIFSMTNQRSNRADLSLGIARTDHRMQPVLVAAVIMPAIGRLPLVEPYLNGAVAVGRSLDQDGTWM